MARAAGVGLRTREHVKGQGGGVDKSEIRDHADLTGPQGGCRTFSFVSRALDEDGARYQVLRPLGSRSVPCGAHKQAHAQSRASEDWQSCGSSQLQLRKPPLLQEHALVCVQSGCAAFHTCATRSTLVWVHRAGEAKQAHTGCVWDAASHDTGAGGLGHSGGSHLAYCRTAKRFTASIRDEGGRCWSSRAWHNCCRRPQAASHTGRAPVTHLDTDMCTARAKASGVAHGPERGGLGRDRYIELAVGQSRGQSRHALA